jgi:selenocysteine-specific elongation factor
VLRAILGTAGHIDHGKTALVRALTGVDTDRLPEEKARGITIDLGFAELTDDSGLRLGVVDVPGHEDFVRTMVAGATGMDVVLLTVAADEGIMPQTREHLDIVQLLAVPVMVVTLTKADLVEAEWLTLVEEEVRETLAGTPYRDAPVLATSARTGEGIEALRAALFVAARGVRTRAEDDVARLPVDRSFTVQGMGTVVTGTLWSGTLSVGAKARILPGDGEARIRSLQVHGSEPSTARAGERTAVALSGVERGSVARGQVLVAGGAWEATWMLTARVGLLPAAPRPLEQGDRVRVLMGTTEVMARCAVLEEAGRLDPGADGWIQLRLEEPVVARAGDRLVLRSYSPLVTVGGGTVAEAVPPKRRRLDPAHRTALATLTGAPDSERIHAVLALASWRGARVESLSQLAGVSPAAAALPTQGSDGILVSRGVAFGPDVVGEAAARVLEAMEGGHASEPLRASVPLERLRGALPVWGSPVLADAVLHHLAGRGLLELAEGGARRPGFTPQATPDQERACGVLESTYGQAGLAAPFVSELPEELRERQDLGQLLRYLEGRGVIRTVDEGLLIAAQALDSAAAAVTASLGGRTGLGPADFRDVLPVSRRHLMPILSYLDGVGVTVRKGPVRDVSPAG